MRKQATYVTPLTQPARLINALGRLIVNGVPLLGIAAAIVWLLVNWLTGCGEAFPTASGEYVYGECVFVPKNFWNPQP